MFPSPQVTQLKIFTNQFAAAFRKRVITPAELAARKAASKTASKKSVKTEQRRPKQNGSACESQLWICHRAQDQRCHSPTTGSSVSGRKSRSSDLNEVSSDVQDTSKLPNLPHLTDMSAGIFLSFSSFLLLLSRSTSPFTHFHS